MAVTRIKSNQITDLAVTNAKIANYAIQGGKLANSLTYGSDLTVSGNLTVSGTTTTVDSVTTTIDDPVLLLASNQTGNAAVDIGILGERGNDTNVFMGYDESADEFVMALTSTADSNSAVTITDYVTTHVGGLTVDDNANITGNVTGGNFDTNGNLVAGGLVSATGNVTGGNLTTAGDVTTATVTATGNITGGNLTTGGTVNATGNVTGGNLTTAGTVTGGTLTDGTASLASGSLTSAVNVTASGTVTGGTLTDGTASLASGSLTSAVNVTASGTVTGGTLTDGTASLASGALSGATTGSFSGNITGGNLVTAGLVSATGNVTGGNLTTGGLVSATGNVTGGNLVTGGAVVATGSGKFGNITIDTDDITTSGAVLTINEAGADVDVRVEGTSNANLVYVDAGINSVGFGGVPSSANCTVCIESTDAIKIPVGTTSQRPSGVAGMIRYNSSTDQVEAWDVTESQFKALGVPSFTVIASESFDGDGSTTAFTLGSSQTTQSCIVSINGVVQLPTSAYSVSGNAMTFTEAPETGDKIEVRQITTTSTVASLANGAGNVTIECADTQVEITGDVVVTGNLTFSGQNFLGQYNHSNVYVVTSTNATNNTGSTLALTAGTLGFDLTQASYYQVFLNRQLLRPAEITVNLTNGTITFASDTLAANDEIEAVFLAT